MLETLQDIFPVQPALYVILQDSDQDEKGCGAMAANDDIFSDIRLFSAQTR